MTLDVPVRVLTYNIRALRDDPAALVEVVRACDPDVVCLQETPRLLRWRTRCAELARRCGLLWVGGGRPAGATAVLAHLRVDVLARREELLSKRRRLHQRGVTTALVRKSGARLSVSSVHLGLDAGERRRHSGEILAAVKRLPAPVAVLAGDLNEPPGQPAWSALTEGGFRDAYLLAPYGGERTFDSRAPRARVDAVLVSSRVHVVRAGVPEDLPGVAAALPRASDHRPVLADLVLGEVATR